MKRRDQDHAHPQQVKQPSFHTHFRPGHRFAEPSPALRAPSPPSPPSQQLQPSSSATSQGLGTRQPPQEQQEHSISPSQAFAGDMLRAHEPWQDGDSNRGQQSEQDHAPAPAPNTGNSAPRSHASQDAEYFTEYIFAGRQCLSQRRMCN